LEREHVVSRHDHSLGVGKLPWPEEMSRNLRSSHCHPTNLLCDSKHWGQRLQPLRQFMQLSSQDGVLNLHRRVLPPLQTDLHLDLAILGLELRYLVRQIIQLLLLPHPGPPRRLPVGDHPLSLPFVNGRLCVNFRCRRSVDCVGRHTLTAGGMHSTLVDHKLEQESPSSKGLAQETRFRL
ncbi:unnamed protein product, partial [Musa acuminata subsp. malaccensis]